MRFNIADTYSDKLVSRENEENFQFAFNKFDFSDRILRLEIIPDEFVDSSKKLRKKKQHRSKNSKKKIVSGSCDGAKVVFTLHINSAILAVKSPFFYNLFANGMRESQKKNDVSLRINASEKATMMKLLLFMYGDEPSASTSVADLIDLLIASDKYMVTSCLRYSVQKLFKLPMSLKCAIRYLELPSCVMVSEIVRPLIDEAKKYIVARYKDFTKSKEEAIKLPLSALELVLGSKGLQVDSEDEVFDFILKWVFTHYPNLHVHQRILTKHLTRFLCFSNMSSSKLKEVLICPNFDQDQVSKLVVEALFSKVEISLGQHIHGSKDLATNNRNFLGRIYRPCCVVYFDLKKDELKSLIHPSKYIDSHTFCLGGKKLFLSAGRHKEHDGFGLFVHKEKDTKSCTITYEFAAKKKSSKEFESKFKVNNRTLGDLGRGTGNLLTISWAEFMSNGCDYFIDNVLHLRAEITLINPKP